MKKDMKDTCSLFYVDESGDLTFFVKNKPADFSKHQVSKYFIIGMCRIKSDINKVKEAFEALRTGLLSDPFVQKIPSSKNLQKMFHAKNDADIVRREVFKLLKHFDFSVQAIVIRKELILNSVTDIYKHTKTKTSINEKELYNDMISRLFTRSLHKNDCCIYFSQRGKTFNDASLKFAIEKAKRNFYLSKGIENTCKSEIHSSQPQYHIGLQIVDYYLWALQRLYEQNDDSYFNLLREDFKLIIDLYDKRNHPYGEYYNHYNAISLDKIKGAS